MKYIDKSLISIKSKSIKPKESLIKPITPNEKHASLKYEISARTARTQTNLVNSMISISPLSAKDRHEGVKTMPVNPQVSHQTKKAIHKAGKSSHSLLTKTKNHQSGRVQHQEELKHQTPKIVGSNSLISQKAGAQSVCEPVVVGPGRLTPQLKSKQTEKSDKEPSVSQSDSLDAVKYFYRPTNSAEIIVSGDQRESELTKIRKEQDSAVQSNLQPTKELVSLSASVQPTSRSREEVETAGSKEQVGNQVDVVNDERKERPPALNINQQTFSNPVTVVQVTFDSFNTIRLKNT